MLITTSLINEIYYIARISGKNFFLESFPEEFRGNTSYLPLTINVSPQGIFKLWYKGVQIWEESVVEDSFFGVESVDTISRIITCIDNGDVNWRSRYVTKHD